MVTFVDEVLGRLELTGDEWVKREGDLLFAVRSDEAEAPRPIPTSLERARWVYAHLDDYRGRAASFAAERLLALKNHSWADEGDDGRRRRLTPTELIDRLTLIEVPVDEAGGVCFVFDDGDLFSGHLVMVELGPDGTWLEATIEG